MIAPDSLLVSVIIPCYNQSHFLGQAIESVLAQTHPHFEILVVDDGSRDSTRQVAALYREVRYIRQKNRGLSAARNTGLRESKGSYLVFLDADDRLLPDCLKTGLECLTAHPECAFVSGHYDLITSEGAPLLFTRRPCVEREHYAALLRANYIGMHATVMYRREVLKLVKGFDTSLQACEDYDLYFRIARRFPVYCHDKVVAEYRRHTANMSRDFALMLRTSLSVLRSQREFAERDRRLKEAYRIGKRSWQEYFGGRLAKQVRAQAKQREWKQATWGLLTLLRYYPQKLARPVGRRVTRLVMSGPKLLSAKLIEGRKAAKQ